jgi:hypothetical protein
VPTNFTQPDLTSTRADDRGFFREFTLTYDVWFAVAGHKLWIGVCSDPTCRAPALIFDDGQRVYPRPLPQRVEDQSIPEAIRHAIFEARKCHTAGAYFAAVVMARRAIQAACLAKGAEGKTLHDQITSLKNKGEISQKTERRFNAVRSLGNAAAHPEPLSEGQTFDEAISKDDAELVLEMTWWIVEELFVHDQQIDRVLSKTKSPAAAKKPNAK